MYRLEGLSSGGHAAARTRTRALSTMEVPNIPMGMVASEGQLLPRLNDASARFSCKRVPALDLVLPFLAQPGRARKMSGRSQ